MPTLCLVVTVCVAVCAIKWAPEVSLRRAPEFVRFRNVEQGVRGVFTVITNGSNFLRLLGVAVVTVFAGVALMRTVKGIDDAGWLNFIPFCAAILTVVAGILLALFAAGARIHTVPTPENPHVNMAFNIMGMCLGALSAVAGKLSNM